MAWGQSKWLRPKVRIAKLAQDGLFLSDDGRPIFSEPWMEEQIWAPFERMDPKDNGTYYNRLGWVYPTGEGKTLQLAMLTIYHCLFSCVDTPRVILAAGSKEQAKHIKSYIKRFILRSPPLLKIFNVQKDIIIQKDDTPCKNMCGRKHGRSEIKVVSSESSLQHGEPRITLRVFDELWNQKNYNLISALKMRPRRVCKEGKTCFIGYPLCPEEKDVPMFDWVNQMLPDSDKRKDRRYKGNLFPRGWLVWRQSLLKDPIQAGLATHQASWWQREDLQRDHDEMMPFQFASMHCGRWSAGSEAMFGEEWEETQNKALEYERLTA